MHVHEVRTSDRLYPAALTRENGIEPRGEQLIEIAVELRRNRHPGQSGWQRPLAESRVCGQSRLVQGGKLSAASEGARSRMPAHLSHLVANLER